MENILSFDILQLFFVRVMQPQKICFVSIASLKLFWPQYSKQNCVGDGEKRRQLFLFRIDTKSCTVIVKKKKYGKHLSSSSVSWTQI